MSCRNTCKTVASALILSLILAACSSRPDDSSKAPDQTQADRAAAEANLQKMLQQKSQKEEYERALAEQQEAARAAEAAKPHYAPAVESAAARPRTWGPCAIEGMGIECHLNSNWTNGKLNYRVAMLGQRQALEQFLLHRKYHINFQDQAGSNLFEFVIAPADFVWDPPGVNGGIPTLETKGQVECDLNGYLPAVQWNLTYVD